MVILRFLQHLQKSSRHKFGYSSAVIAWHLNDAPTDADIEEVVEEFEVHAFAGLEKDQYHMTVVQHDDDDGSKHLHILVPRFELTSGKSLNIAPPGHQKYFDALRDYFNIKKNWARQMSIHQKILRFSRMFITNMRRPYVLV